MVLAVLVSCALHGMLTPPWGLRCWCQAKLLAKVPIPEDQILPTDDEIDSLAGMADDYESLLRWGPVHRTELLGFLLQVTPSLEEDEIFALPARLSCQPGKGGEGHL